MDYRFEKLENTTNTTTTAPPDDRIAYDKDYIRTLPSLLKIAEMIVDFIIFITAFFGSWGYLGGSWVHFVATSALITTLISFILYMFRITEKLPFNCIFIEFLYYCIYTVLFCISTIICIARSAQFHLGSMIASAIFCWAAFVLYSVDTYFQFRKWQVARLTNTSATTTTSTTVTTHTETYVTPY